MVSKEIKMQAAVEKTKLTPVQQAAERVRIARTFAAMRQDDASAQELREALEEFTRVRAEV
jgi:hypothetical protein